MKKEKKVHRITRIIHSLILCLLFLNFLPAATRAEFHKEVTMDMTELRWTTFDLYMPEDVLYEFGAGSWQEQWHTAPEEAAGKDEVYVRMDVAETSEIWLEGWVRGYLEYDLLDSSGNLLVKGMAVTGFTNGYLDGSVILAREVFPAGTYYWRFHDYRDADCLGMCTLEIRATSIIKAENDDRYGSNNSKTSAKKIEDNTSVKGYLSRFENDREDWYYFNVEDASSENLVISCSNMEIGYEIFDEAGNCIMQEDYVEKGPGELQLSDGNYYIRLTPVFHDMYPDIYTGGRYFGGFRGGGTYSISYTQTKNVHLVPAASIILDQTSVTLNPDPMAGLWGANTVTVTARLLPENTTDTIVWQVGDENLVDIYRRSSEGNVYTCTIYSSFLEGGRTSLTAATSGQSSLRAQCDVIVNEFNSQTQGGGSGSGNAGHPDWYITFDSTELSLAPGREAYISFRCRGNDTIQWTSSDEKVVTVDGWHIKTISPGKAVVTASFKNNPDIKAECTVTVTGSISAQGNDPNDAWGTDDNRAANPAGQTVKTGTVLSNASASYIVQENRNTVSYNGPRKKTVKSVKIPATVKLGSKTYKVTSIAAKAFSGCKKLKKVIISKNITNIGKKAFYGCSKLSRITIQSKVLKKVGSQALKGTPKKLVIKVPAGMKKTYKKLLKAKGNKKATVK